MRIVAPMPQKGGPRIPQNPIFFEKRKKSSKTQKLKNVQKYAKISDMPFDQRSLIHREAWFSGGPRIPQNLIFLKNGKIIQNAKTQVVQRNAKISDTPFDQSSLIHLEGKISKKNFFFFSRCDFRPLPNKNVQMLDHFFPLLFPKDSESQKILDIRLQEVGAKRHLNGTSKVNGQTDTHTDRRTNRLIESIGPEGRCFENPNFAPKFFS